MVVEHVMDLGSLAREDTILQATMNTETNPWNVHADAYARWIEKREPVDARAAGRAGPRHRLSPQLIEIARNKGPDRAIEYRVGDLSQSLPALRGQFDVIASYLELNDVRDYQGFASTLASLVRPGGQIALAFNNPYSSVIREHVADYFASDTLATYTGLARQGVEAHYYRRTLEDYVDAFLAAQLTLVKLADVPDTFGLEWLLPNGYRFPRFIILVFERPSEP